MGKRNAARQKGQKIYNNNGVQSMSSKRKICWRTDSIYATIWDDESNGNSAAEYEGTTDKGSPKGDSRKAKKNEEIILVIDVNEA